MEPNMEAHPGEDQLERYALGRLSEPEVAPLEEHLLLCPSCQDRLAELDQFVAAMQEVAPRLQTRTAKQVDQPSWWNPGNWLSWFPKPLGAVAFAALAVLFVIAIRNRTTEPVLTGPPVEVRLSLYRGGGADSAAPRGRLLHLTIDLTEIEAAPEYRVAVVNATGRTLMEDTVTRQGAALIVPVRHQLAAGNYWVRLYHNADQDSLIREFALRVQ